MRVLDTSVVINLLALETELARGILAARGGAFATTTIVTDLEARRDPRDPQQSAGPRLDALTRNLVDRVELEGAVEARFVDLCFRLGDGEAATLAYCESMGGIALLDDGEARLDAARGNVVVESSTDLLLNEKVVGRLGRRVLADAVFDALRIGRMHVPQRHWRDVIQLVGEDRARQCPSIPARALASPHPKTTRRSTR